MCTTGFFLGKICSIYRPLNKSAGNVLHGWLLALTIIVVHMVLLSLVLYRIYVYEQNLTVLGNLYPVFPAVSCLNRGIFMHHILDNA